MGIVISEEAKGFLVVMAVIGVILYVVLKDFGLGQAILGLRSTRRVRVEDEPRDQAERWLSNHRKVSKTSKPRVLKFLALTGDLDIPPNVVGRVTGLEPHQEGYLAYVKTSFLGWSKPYIFPRELCSDANRRTLFIRARGFTTNGLYRIPLPLARDPLTPDMTLRRSRRIFKVLFGLQDLVDTEEDAAWARSAAMMPSVQSRISMAEAEAPHLVERPYMKEEQVVGR